MEILRFLHSWNRWIVLVVAIVAIVYYVYGLLQKRSWDSNAARLATIFPRIIGVQWILGLLFIASFAFASGSFNLATVPRHQWEHAFTMTIVIAIAEAATARVKRMEVPDNIRYRNSLILVIAVLVIIFIGISVLPSVIQWRFFTGA